jgi:hypothetical protein
VKGRMHSRKKLLGVLVPVRHTQSILELRALVVRIGVTHARHRDRPAPANGMRSDGTIASRCVRSAGSSEWLTHSTGCLHSEQTRHKHLGQAIARADTTNERARA